jgi:hypothetical protein
MKIFAAKWTPSLRSSVRLVVPISTKSLPGKPDNYKHAEPLSIDCQGKPAWLSFGTNRRQAIVLMQSKYACMPKSVRRLNQTRISDFRDSRDSIDVLRSPQVPSPSEAARPDLVA